MCFGIITFAVIFISTLEHSDFIADKIIFSFFLTYSIILTIMFFDQIEHSNIKKYGHLVGD